VPGLRVYSTRDIRIAMLRELAADLESDGIHVEVETSQSFFKSALPPSWISFLGDLP